jgi:hypothetical protein
MKCGVTGGGGGAGLQLLLLLLLLGFSPQPLPSDIGALSHPGLSQPLPIIPNLSQALALPIKFGFSSYLGDVFSIRSTCLQQK